MARRHRTGASIELACEQQSGRGRSRGTATHGEGAGVQARTRCRSGRTMQHMRSWLFDPAAPLSPEQRLRRTLKMESGDEAASPFVRERECLGRRLHAHSARSTVSGALCVHQQAEGGRGLAAARMIPE